MNRILVWLHHVQIDSLNAHAVWNFHLKSHNHFVPSSLMPALPKRQPGMVIYALVASKRARLRRINAGHIAPNLDDALGPKQHRISCETYPNAESAKASFFDSSVRWEEWAMDKGMAGNLIPEASRSAGERIKPRSVASLSTLAALVTGLDAPQRV
jgi:hypothetical protein